MQGPAPGAGCLYVSLNKKNHKLCLVKKGCPSSEKDYLTALHTLLCFVSKGIQEIASPSITDHTKFEEPL